MTWMTKRRAMMIANAAPRKKTRKAVLALNVVIYPLTCESDLRRMARKFLHRRARFVPFLFCLIMTIWPAAGYSRPRRSRAMDSILPVLESFSAANLSPAVPCLKPSSCRRARFASLTLSVNIYLFPKQQGSGPNHQDGDETR